MQDIHIRPFQQSDPVPVITALVNAAYAPLAGLGLGFSASYQADGVTERRLLTGLPFVVTIQSVIVATVTVYPTASQSQSDWYRRTGVYHFGQFAVHPGAQKRGIGSQLLRFIEGFARDNSARELGLTTKQMPSGAGHDAQDMARIGPVGMIFIPSIGGISHSPKEFSRPKDIENGANVLLGTLLKLDKT